MNKTLREITIFSFLILSTFFVVSPFVASADTGIPDGNLISSYNSETNLLTVSGNYINAEVSNKKRPGFAVFINDNNPGTESLDSEVNYLPLASAGNFSNTYNLTTTPQKVCVVVYDIHLSDGSPKDGDLVPAGSTHNGDNSWNKANTSISKLANSYSSSACSSPSIILANHPPTLTLVGTNPVTITVGDVYTDAGATAQDEEDGNITANIVKTGTVDSSVAGTYTITYNVSDSKGLAATPVSRNVSVVPKIESLISFISASKIVCGSETDLPNWGDNGPDISSTTARDFVASHPNCHLVDWSFEWASSSAANPGDHNLLGGSGWTPFMGSTSVQTSDMVWVREQFNSNYTTFTGANTTESVSAELYCDKDVLHYDNYDFVGPMESGKTYYCVAWNVLKNVPPANHPPVLTLVGTNPVTITVGDVYTDAGATAQDEEDGNITANIVKTGTVDSSVAGTYTITYNVSDSKGLAATPVSRTVNVLNGPPSPKGKISFCLVLGDEQNVIATSSYALPTGSFALKLSTTTEISTTTIDTKVWNSGSFNPNRKIILSGFNDADCYTFDNLELGNYYYSELGVSGSSWNTPKYSDQFDQPVNNVFDLFSYNPQLFNSLISDDSSRNLNADGMITLYPDNKDRTVVLFVTHKPVSNGNGGGSGASVDLSVTKTADKSSANVGDTVVYTITVINNGPQDATEVSLKDILPSGLSFISSSSTGIYATTTGLWTIGDLKNTASSTLVLITKVNSGTEGQNIINTAVASSSQPDPSDTNNTASFSLSVNKPTVTPPTSACTSNCGGGGGGGGGNGPIVGSYGGVNPNPVVLGASTTTTSTPNSCYYLFDYLRKDFNNNPVEVKKLQVFLRDLEGFTSVQITGVYDDQTISALNQFQNRYKDDILTPWGHTAPTSYTYILTKKKVNEIYCKKAFPVTPLQQSEIDSYRNFLMGLKNSGVTLPGSNGSVQDNNVDNTPVIDVVGKTPDSSKPGSVLGDLTTLAGSPTTTDSITRNLTASVILSAKKMAGIILNFIKKPIEMFWGNSGQCFNDSKGPGFFNLLLLLIILLISYLWYRERRNNKKIEEINKEIDLN